MAASWPLLSWALLVIPLCDHSAHAPLGVSTLSVPSSNARRRGACRLKLAGRPAVRCHSCTWAWRHWVLWGRRRRHCTVNGCAAGVQQVWRPGQGRGCQGKGPPIKLSAPSCGTSMRVCLIRQQGHSLPPLPHSRTVCQSCAALSCRPFVKYLKRCKARHLALRAAARLASLPMYLLHGAIYLAASSVDGFNQSMSQPH